MLLLSWAGRAGRWPSPSARASHPGSASSGSIRQLGLERDQEGEAAFRTPDRSPGGVMLRSWPRRLLDSPLPDACPGSQARFQVFHPRGQARCASRGSGQLSSSFWPSEGHPGGQARFQVFSGLPALEGHPEGQAKFQVVLLPSCVEYVALEGMSRRLRLQYPGHPGGQAKFRAIQGVRVIQRVRPSFKLFLALRRRYFLEGMSRRSRIRVIQGVRPSFGPSRGPGRPGWSPTQAPH